MPLKKDLSKRLEVLEGFFSPESSCLLVLEAHVPLASFHMYI